MANKKIPEWMVRIYYCETCAKAHYPSKKTEGIVPHFITQWKYKREENLMYFFRSCMKCHVYKEWNEVKKDWDYFLSKTLVTTMTPKEWSEFCKFNDDGYNV